MKLTTIKSIVAAAMCAVLGVSGAGNARAAEEVKYLDWDAEQGKLVEKSTTDYSTYTGQTLLTAGQTYVVKSDVTVSSGIVVGKINNLAVRLILCDGKKLTAQKGVQLYSGTALIICGQKEGSGVLQAMGEYNFAGIGGGNSKATADSGDVTINGGVVTATGGGDAAGIGGGPSGVGGNVTINGGTVTAEGGSMGIGGGSDSTDPGTVTFGANFVGGVKAGNSAEKLSFMTTTEYESDFGRFRYVTMPVVPVGENTYAEIVGGSYSITGTGSVTNFPKALNRESITSAKFGTGITEIGARLFKDCTNLKTVTLGRDVKTFGEKAFYKCYSLETINVASADSLDALTGAVNYHMMYDDKGNFVMAPKIILASYVEMLYGKKNLLDAEWDPIGKLSEQNLEELKAADEYHFFQTRLEAEQW